MNVSCACVCVARVNQPLDFTEKEANHRKRELNAKRLRDVWISAETHFRVFDMASEMINNS